MARLAKPRREHGRRKAACKMWGRRRRRRPRKRWIQTLEKDWRLERRCEKAAEVPRAVVLRNKKKLHSETNIELRHCNIKRYGNLHFNWRKVAFSRGCGISLLSCANIFTDVPKLVLGYCCACVLLQFSYQKERKNVVSLDMTCL